MEWREYVVTDPTVLAGKPIVAGTRLSVDFLLNLFGKGWTEQQILGNYPELTEAGLHAVFVYAAECLQEDKLYPLNKRAVG